MEKTDSFKKQEEEYRRKTRRRFIIIALSSVLLLLLVIGSVVVPVTNSASSSSNEKQSIESVCNVTLYQESCYSSIFALKQSTKTSNSNPDTPKQIFMLSLQVALNELTALKSSTFRGNGSTYKALDVCSRLVEDAADHVNMSASSLSNSDSIHWAEDVRTWLSTAITDQQTCLEALTNESATEIRASMANAAVFTSNSLAIVSKIPALIQGRRNKRVVQSVGVEMADLRPNLTVAKDDSGNYKTITEAVNAMPKRSKRRFYIYVKRGEYNENVVVGKDSWNLIMYGDGAEKTVVSSNLNIVDGVSTYDSGTLIAEGRGFVARDMGFKNTAGPEKFQAVAVRSSADHSIFYRCHIEGYQDTLFTHSNRQFYRECVIRGTIDFIFGNAAAVFQNCSIEARQPMKGQYNTMTAQSKSDPNQNTGFSIQRCSIGPQGNLTARTYLGRPWRVYSTTVVLETGMEGIIDPEGWTVWEPATQAPDSIFYAEYKNNGPGSGLSGRVTWPGYKPEIKDEEAQQFSVQNFIQGNQWIDGLNIGYDPHI